MTAHTIPVLGYEGLYEISTEGVVTSTPDGRRNPRNKTHRTLAISTRTGIPTVRLCKNGAVRSVNLARLVLSHFVGPPPSPKHEACHIDHDLLNNSTRNLMWGTRLLNEQQKTAAGRRPKGTKYSRELAASLKQMRDDGMPMKKISAAVGINYTTVCSLITGHWFRKYHG